MFTTQLSLFRGSRLIGFGAKGLTRLSGNSRSVLNCEDAQ